MNKSLLPKWPFRILGSFCPDPLYEEIEGDLIQKFNKDVKAVGEQRAKRRLVWNVIRFCRPGIILRNKLSVKLNQWYMFSNYFKISVRTLLKNRIFSMINISGLAIGMSVFLLIAHYIRFEKSYEDYNEKASDVFRITLDIYKGEEYVMTDCGMYAPIGAMLKEQMPEVLDFARMWQHGNQEVKVGTNVFYEEQIYFADPSALSMFSFNVLSGNAATALSDPFQVMISESMAMKYFNRLDVLNETIEIKKNRYKITGVLADSPANTHLKAQFLLSHASLAKRTELDYKENEFQGNSEYTYLLMTEGADLSAFNEKLNRFSLDQANNIGDDRIVADRMKDIHLYSNKAYEPEVNGNARSVYFLLVIAISILVIAWINYVNLSTARAINRAREVGIRKVIGSLRIQLIWQFLSESFLVSLLAAALSLVIIYMALPVIINLSGQTLPVNIFATIDFWYLFVGILFFGSILSGLYPAFVLSSFRPIAVLKGKFSSSLEGQWLRKGLVIFQFASTVILIICVSTVYKQINFLQQQELGMNIEQMLVLRSPTLKSDSVYLIKAATFKKELNSLSGINRVTQSGVLPGLSLADFSTTGNVLRPGQEKNDKGFIYYINPIDENFIPAFEMKLIAGKNFENDKSTDTQVIINEATMHALGFKNAEEAVGSTLLAYNQQRSIIGVLKNFHQRSPKEKHIPMVYWYSNQADYFSLKVSANDMQQAIASVIAVWDKVYPDSPVDYFFLDQKYNQQYKSDQQFGDIIGVFSTLAILIACLGLFGLSSYTVVQRSKEIGIRKILGSSVTQIVNLLSRNFIRLMLIAGIVAMPFAYFVMDEWLSGFAVRININVWMFIVPVISIICIAMITIGFQTIQAAHTNPVDHLKHE